MTTNARALRDNASDNTGFAKLPNSAEAAAILKGGAGQQQQQQQQDSKPILILGKFKNVEDLEKSYQALEARLGQSGNEIGQLRSLTDKLLGLKQQETEGNGGRKAPAKVTSDELLNDPQAAIERVVGERTAQLEAEVAQQRMAEAKRVFSAKHPTYEADMSDPAFIAFFQGSAYRSQLATKTASGDVSAADELWTAYEEHRKTAAPDKGQKKEEADRESQLRAAALVGGGGGSQGEGASGGGKPIYSRSQIVEMRLTNPSYYYSDEFQEVLKQAYIEKRVR